MIEMVLDTRKLPKPMALRIHTKKVKVRETGGSFVITPLREDSVVCPLLGMFADGKISSEKFIAQKQNEKELEL